MMKNYTLLCILFCAIFSVNAQVSIGTGTLNNQEIPINPSNEYSYSQIIYTAEEINTSGAITGLKFYKSGLDLTNSEDWTVSIGYTDLLEFETYTDWVSESTLEQVFNGVVTQGVSGVVEIIFSTPFLYNGFDNLVIGIDENSAGVGSSSDDFYSTSSFYSQSLVYSNNGVNPSPINPPIANVAFGGLKFARPNITFLGLNHTCQSSFTDIYSQGFTNYLPNCWTEMEGLLSANTEFTNTTSSDWDDIAFGNTGYNIGAQVNISWSIHKEWLMSPSFDLGTETDYQLEFDVAMTRPANTDPPICHPDDIFAAIISTDNGTTWSNTNILRSWTAGSIPSTTGDHIVLDLSSYTGEIKIGFYGGSTSSSNSKLIHLDNFFISASPVCPAPNNLTISNITDTTADLGWDEGGAANVQIEYGPIGFQLGTGTSVLGASNTYTLSGLTSSLTYDVYIRDICGPGDTSHWILGPTLSPTCFDAILPTYIQDFDNYIPNCWTEMRGSLGATGTTITDATSSNWDTDGFAVNGTSGSAMLWYSYLSVDNEWLISPSIDLGTTIDYQVGFDLALTLSGNTGPADLQSGDKFVVVISTDNGATWAQSNALQTWTPGNEPNNNGEFIALDLSDYTGLVKIGFYCERPSTNNSNRRMFVDNFQVKPLDTCPKPSLVTVSNIQDSSADLTWTIGASNTEIEYGPSGFTPGIDEGIIIITPSNPYNLTGLMEQTDYDVYLRDICMPGDTSDYTMVSSFTTTCSIIATTYSEDFTNWEPNCWSKMQGRLGVSGTVIVDDDYSSWNRDGFGNVGTTGSAKVEISGTSKDEWLVSPSIDLGIENNNQLTFDVALTSTNSTSQGNLYSDDTLAVVISTNNGVTWSQANILQVWVDNSEPSNTGDFINIDLSAYSGAIKIGFYGASSVYGGFANAYIDNFVIGPAPTCVHPNAISVTNIGSDNAQVAWLGASNVEIEYGPLGYLIGTGTSVFTDVNPFTLTDLLSLTDYDIYVRSICAVGDTSYYSAVTSFATECGIYHPLYGQDFLEYLPTCWTEMQGILGATSTPITNAILSNWHNDGIGNLSSTGGAGCSVNSSAKEWLISPSIDLGTETAHQLEFIISATGSGNTNPAVFDNDDSLAVVLSTDNGITWQQSNILKVWTDADIPLNTGEYVVLDLSIYTGIVKFGFYAGSQSGSISNIQLDDFRILPLESCLTPIDIDVLGVTDVSADIACLSGSSNAQIEYGPTGFEQGTGTLVVGTTNPFTLTGLADNTSYSFYMRSICAVGDTSGWSLSNGFRTDCPVYLPPYYTNMETSPPYCWTWMRGRLGLTSTVVTNSSISSWSYGWFGNTVAGTMSAKMDLSGSYHNEWLISPSIDLGAENGTHLEFNVALTQSYTSEAVNFATDDTLAVVISTNNGETWSLANTLQIFDIANQPSNTGDFISIDLSAYTGIVKFGFYASSNVSGTAVKVHVDNFEIALCGAPVNVNLDAVTSSTAEISWLMESSNSNFEYGLTGFTPGTGISSNSSTGSTLISDLISTTSYEYYIQNVCGSDSLSNWSGPFTFTTTCPEYTPTYTEEFAAYLPYCWEEKEGALGSVNTSFTSNNSTAWTYDGFGNVESSGAAKINFSGTGGDDWLISPTIDLGDGSIPYQVQFDVALTTWENTDLDVLSEDDSLAFIISTDNGLTWSSENLLKTWTAGSEPSNLGELIILELQAYTGLVKFGFYMATTVSGGNVNMYLDNFEVKPIPSCQQPLNLSINNLTNISVEVSWTAGASNSVIEYGAPGFVPGTGTIILTSTATELVSGLVPNTNYDIYVMDSCGVGDVSAWTGPINFTSECDVIVPNHFEIFTSPLPDCWSKFRGPLGATSTLVTNPYSSLWTGDGFGNVTSVGAVKLNIYSPASNGDRFEWLVSPAIDLGDGTTDYLLEFDLASTYYYNTSDANFDSDDYFAVLISIDNGITWNSTNVLQSWQEGTEPSNTGDHINLSLLGYTGVIKLAFYGETTGSGGNVNVYVDNFAINTCLPSVDSITAFACNSYTAPSGAVYTSSELFNDTIVNVMGCDSIITIDLTVEQHSSHTINATVCDEYISDVGNLYTSTGIYTETFMNAVGCDSVVTLNLDITSTNLSVTQVNGIQLTSNANGVVQYQWVDCTNGNLPIIGEINQTFIAESNGSYACEITNGNCVSLTDCYEVNNVSINEISKLVFAIYPNPTSSELTIEVISQLQDNKIIITNIIGEIVYSDILNARKKTIDVSSLNAGVYVISLTGKGESNQLLFTIK